MQNIEYVYYKNKKVRMSFNWFNVNDVGNTLDLIVSHFGEVYLRIEKGERLYLMLRKSSTCMKCISITQQKVQEEVLKGFKMTNCTFPRVFKLNKVGKKIEAVALNESFDDGNASFEK